VRGGRFVRCVSGVPRLVVLVSIGRMVSRIEATVMTRDSRMRGKGGLSVCVFCVVDVFW